MNGRKNIQTVVFVIIDNDNNDIFSTMMDEDGEVQKSTKKTN